MTLSEGGTEGTRGGKDRIWVFTFSFLYCLNCFSSKYICKICKIRCKPLIDITMGTVITMMSADFY